jgi:rhodanese-related sulfurtransferase
LLRLARLDGATALWPTHGGGSFCSSSATEAGAVSTVGTERTTNPLLRAGDEDTFVDLLLATQGSRPAYFDRLGEINRRGPRVVGAAPVLDAIPATEAAALVADGAELVDVRPVRSFASGHPDGALSIPLRPAFASWLGWLAPHDRPIVVLREEGQDAQDLLWQAVKIGYENIRGEVAGGIEAWSAAGLPVASVPVVGPAEVDSARVLDVRQDSEYIAGHLPGADHFELGDLVDRAGQVEDVPTVVMCGHGERAAGAASLLARAGHRDVRILDGGPADVAAALGVDLQGDG